MQVVTKFVDNDYPASHVLYYGVILKELLSQRTPSCGCSFTTDVLGLNLDREKHDALCRQGKRPTYRNTFFIDEFNCFPWLFSFYFIRFVSQCRPFLYSELEPLATEKDRPMGTCDLADCPHIEVRMSIVKFVLQTTIEAYDNSIYTEPSYAEFTKFTMLYDTQSLYDFSPRVMSFAPKDGVIHGVILPRLQTSHFQEK